MLPLTETKQCGSLPGASVGGDAASGRSGPANAVRVATESLIDIAVEGDRRTAQLIACQEYIRRTQEAVK